MSGSFSRAPKTWQVYAPLKWFKLNYSKIKTFPVWQINGWSVSNLYPRISRVTKRTMAADNVADQGPWQYKDTALPV